MDINTLKEKTKSHKILLIVIIVIVAVVLIIAAIIVIAYFLLRKKESKRFNVRPLLNGTTPLNKIKGGTTNHFLSTVIPTIPAEVGTFGFSNAILSPNGKVVLIMQDDGILYLAKKETLTSDWKVIWDSLKYELLDAKGINLLPPFLFIVSSPPAPSTIDQMFITGKRIRTVLPEDIVIFQKQFSNPDNLDTYIEVYDQGKFEYYHLSISGTKTVLFSNDSPP